MKNLHIVYLAERIDIKGGIERSLTTRVNYLIKKYNYSITIICTEKNTGIPAYNLDKSVNIIFLENLNSKKYLISRIWMRYNQAKMIININPDIIVTVKYTLHNLFFRLLNTKQIKLISEMREVKENYDANINKSLKTRVNALLRNYILKKQDVMIVLTEADKRSWGYINIKVVPNPQTIQTDVVSNLNAKQVLSIGRLVKVKGFDKLIEVWQIVNKKHPSWKLKICGEGIEYINLYNQIKILNLQESISLTNKFVPVIPEFLNSSIFVLTSQFESFGNVMVESKVCGVPIVAFDAPNGPREIIVDGEDGFIVPLNDIIAMADRIIYLIEDSIKRKGMGKFAKQNSQKYNLEKIVKLYNQTIIS